jgi:hypothetical protein
MVLRCNVLVSAMNRQTLNWIVIRRPLRGHNDTPFGRPTPGRPKGHPRVGHPQGEFGVFSYYQLAMLFLNMVCLTMALACIVMYNMYPIVKRPLQRGYGMQ